MISPTTFRMVHSPQRFVLCREHFPHFRSLPSFGYLAASVILAAIARCARPPSTHSPVESCRWALNSGFILSPNPKEAHTMRKHRVIKIIKTLPGREWGWHMHCMRSAYVIKSVGRRLYTWQVTCRPYGSPRKNRKAHKIAREGARRVSEELEPRKLGWSLRGRFRRIVTALHLTRFE